MVKHGVMGNGDVHVPTHLFKVIYKHNRSTTLEIYILPNQTLPPNTQFSSTNVTIIIIMPSTLFNGIVVLYSTNGEVERLHGLLSTLLFLIFIPQEDKMVYKSIV